MSDFCFRKGMQFILVNNHHQTYFSTLEDQVSTNAYPAETNAWLCFLLKTVFVWPQYHKINCGLQAFLSPCCLTHPYFLKQF